jgi:hypothetical protein
MAHHIAWMLLLSVAAAVAPQTRRTALRHTAYAVAATAAPASAKDLYYTKQDFCEKSDQESRNGIEFGCEQYVQSPEKRARMRTRSLVAVQRASDKLDTYRVDNAASGALIRGALRKDPLDGLRAQGRRLATLTKTSDAGLKYDDAIARVDALDRALRKLDIDGSAGALASAAKELDAAQGALRRLVAVGGEGEVLAPINVPLPKGCSPDGRGCGPLDVIGLDLSRPDLEARKASGS